MDLYSLRTPGRPLKGHAKTSPAVRDFDEAARRGAEGGTQEELLASQDFVEIEIVDFPSREPS